MSTGDMFLKLDAKRAGKIRGESRDSVHAGEIDVVDWSWGMTSPTSLAGTGATARTAMSALHIVKRVDLASTALMSAMRSNDMLRKAVLTVRKAGGPTALDYLVIEIENGRIANYGLTSMQGSAPELMETLDIVFTKIQVEYRLQDDKGGQKSTTTFSTEILPA